MELEEGLRIGVDFIQSRIRPRRKTGSGSDISETGSGLDLEKKSARIRNLPNNLPNKIHLLLFYIFI